VALFTPLPTLIIIGQEHVLNAVLTLAFAFSSAKVLAEERPRRGARVLPSLLVVPLVMSRYEGLFLVFVVVCLLALRRRPIDAVVLGALALLPVISIGWVAISKGWYVLPSSVTLKGKMFPLPAGLDHWRLWETLGISWKAQGIGIIARQKPINWVLLVSSFVVGAAAYLNARRMWTVPLLLSTMLIGTVCLHSLFAKVGSLFRYEAYLVALSLVVLAVSLQDRGMRWDKGGTARSVWAAVIAPILIAAAVVLPFVPRGLEAIGTTARATTNIYEQQYQMGRFLARYYDGTGVALNDIGATNFLADTKCLDLLGLASQDVARAKRDGRFGPASIENMARAAGVKIAMVYPNWFRSIGGLPDIWVEVGWWGIENNVVCGDDLVAIYAVDPTEIYALREHLRDFSRELPRTVIQGGY
jgi:hypothetical protein